MNIFDEENQHLSPDDDLTYQPSNSQYVNDENDEDTENVFSDNMSENYDSEELIKNEDYKLTHFSDNFLRSETQIQVENSKTKIKFKYRDIEYKGVVMKKLQSEDDYIFLVELSGKSAKGIKNNDKKIKKIHIPDASLICIC